MKNLLELAEFARRDPSLIGNHCRGKLGVDAAIRDLLAGNHSILEMIEGDVQASVLRARLLQENVSLSYALTAYSH